jgi:DNA-binding transcriptional ArsR family regulator
MVAEGLRCQGRDPANYGRFANQGRLATWISGPTEPGCGRVRWIRSLPSFTMRDPSMCGTATTKSILLRTGSVSTEHHAYLLIWGISCWFAMNAPAVLELPLDDALLKVLSSESRREILRLLRERRMTGAELAQRLDLGKPAVAEHLKKLQEAELIERQDDPERRWVYYNLTARGRGILEPQRVRFYLVMSVAALALMVGVALTLGFMVLFQGGQAESLAAFPGSDGQGTDANLIRPPGTPAHSIAAEAGNTTAPPATTDRILQGDLPKAAPLPVSSQGVASPTLILDERSGTSPLKPASQAGAVTVLLYRARDVDATNNTVRLHVVTLNATQLAAANLTKAAENAASVPGLGLLLEVPDDTPLLAAQGTIAVDVKTTNATSETGTNGTQQSPTSAAASQPAPDSTTPATSTREPQASSTPPTSQTEATAPASQPVTTATATQPVTTAPGATSSSPQSDATPSVAPQPAALPDAVQTPMPSGEAPDSVVVEPAGPTGPQWAATVDSAKPHAAAAPLRGANAAPIPLLALLGAALVVSLLRRP